MHNAQHRAWICASCLSRSCSRLANKLLRHVHPALVGNAALAACMLGMQQLRQLQRTPLPGSLMQGMLCNRAADDKTYRRKSVAPKHRNRYQIKQHSMGFCMGQSMRKQRRMVRGPHRCPRWSSSTASSGRQTRASPSHGCCACATQVLHSLATNTALHEQWQNQACTSAVCNRDLKLCEAATGLEGVLTALI